MSLHVDLATSISFIDVSGCLATSIKFIDVSGCLATSINFIDVSGCLATSIKFIDVSQCLATSINFIDVSGCLATSIKILAGWGASLGDDDDDDDDDTDLYIDHIQELVLFDEQQISNDILTTSIITGLDMCKKYVPKQSIP